MGLFDLTCRLASRLLVERRARRLALRERVSLALHLRVCRMCRRFDVQLGVMDRALGRWKAYRDDLPDDPER